jgi:hypothetical protein
LVPHQGSPAGGISNGVTEQHYLNVHPPSQPTDANARCWLEVVPH